MKKTQLSTRGVGFPTSASSGDAAGRAHVSLVAGVAAPGAEARGWIRVADELPDADETVLVYCPQSIEPVWLGFLDGEDWRDVSGTSLAEELPTHWMRMPVPPSTGIESGVVA
jgi:hypothetical protein